MGTDIEALDSADNTLLQLKEQQENIGKKKWIKNNKKVYKRKI